MISKWKKLVGLLNTSNTQINPATEDKQDSLLTELQLKADLTETQPVSAASLPLPTGAATAANQTTGNGILTTIDADTGTILTNQTNGNQISEIYTGGSAVSSSNTLEVTSYDSSGNEGIKIIGADWVSGNDGIDSNTNTLQVIDYAHHERHSGTNFCAQHNQSNIPATGSSGCLTIAFFVPNQTKEPHLIWETSHEGSMDIVLYEGVTFNASVGTDKAPVNVNRNSSGTSVLQGKATGSLVSDYVTVGENSSDAIFSGGTEIYRAVDYSARNTSGAQAGRGEIILKTNTNYAFCLENNETSAQGGQIRLDWYEHSDKNP